MQYRKKPFPGNWLIVLFLYKHVSEGYSITMNHNKKYIIIHNHNMAIFMIINILFYVFWKIIMFWEVIRDFSTIKMKLSCHRKLFILKSNKQQPTTNK